MVPSTAKIKASPASSPTPGTGKKGFQAIPYYQHGWEILKKDPFVFLWKVLADFFGRATSFALLILLGSLLVIDLTFFLDSGSPLLAWFARLTEVVRSPLFLAGLAGTLAITFLIKVAVESFVVGGIWGVIADDLHGSKITRGTTFAARALQHFPEVLALFLLRFALRTLAILLISGVGLAIFMGYTSGSLGELSSFAQSFLLAATLACWALWFALTRLTIEVVAAPMILDKKPLGESILEAADFVIANFWALYRLLIFSLGLLLIPLFGYWLVLMVNNLTLIWPALTPMTMLLRFIAEVLLWLSISALGVLFYGALFSFFHTGHLESPTPQSTHPSDPNPHPGQKGSFSTPHPLTDLLPQDAPNRFQYSEIFQDSPGEADEDLSPEKQEALDNAHKSANSQPAPPDSDTSKDFTSQDPPPPSKEDDES